jgi:enoyl-CoA hydratase/carnithine racemase
MVFETVDTATPGRRIGIARLDRPGQLNALNLAMCASMLDTFRAWASDESIACVMLAGNGPNVSANAPRALLWDKVAKARFCPAPTCVDHHQPRN